MDERTLAGILKNRITDSIGLSGDQLSDDRIKALKYYRGDPLGNEREGKSQVVSRDVAEAVDGVLPALMKIFTSGDETVKFEPRGPEDEEPTKQATDYVNWIVMQQNEGFRLFNTWFKDALLQRTGVLKVWWDESEEVTREEYRNLTEEEYQIISADPDIEIEAEEESGLWLGSGPAPMDMPMRSYNVTVRKTNKAGRVCIEAVPPEEFLIERWAVDLDQALFCAHRFRRTVSELVQMGFDRQKVVRASGYDIADYAGERTARFENEDQLLDEESDDEATRYVWVTECYLKVDYDGDGIAELRKVTAAGDSEYEILDNEETDEYPFAALSPILMPHKFHGMSVADQVLDLQLLKTSLWRQMLDNLYLANDPQRVVQDGKVNLDDILSGGPGRVIRATGDINAVIREVAVPFVAQHTFPMMEYIDGVREQRTGITRYSQGLDANSLNKTATGVSIIQSAAQQRQELIARVFAETGVKRLFRLVLKCVTKYQQKPQMIRLRGNWVPMDPRGWKNNYDMSIAVGLGTGNKEQQLATIMQLLQVDAQIIEQQGGIEGPILTAKNLYNTLAKLVEAAGLKSPEPYYTDPENAPPQQPKPSPEQMKAEAEIQKMQAEFQLKQQEAQANLQQKQQEAIIDAQLERMKADAQMEIERFKATVQMEIEQMKAGIQARIAEQKAMDDSRRADMKAEADAQRMDAKTESDMARADQMAKADAARAKEGE